MLVCLGGHGRSGTRDRLRIGGVAQLGERLVCNQEAIGSIPFTSTILRSKSEGYTVLRATDGKPSFSLRAKDALRSSEASA